MTDVVLWALQTVMRCALIWCVSVGVCAAQSVTLRSGAHEGFTRLVLDVPEDLRWQATQGEDGRSFRVEFAQSGYAIDVSRVFDRIDRARVANVDALPGGAGIDIALSCDCQVEVAQIAGQMIVLDISPRPVGEVPNSAAAPVAAQVESGPMPKPTLDLGLLPERGQNAGGRALLPRFDPEAASNSMATTALETSEDLRISGDFARSLAEQLARGATQGLLEPDLPSLAPAAPEGPAEEQDADVEAPRPLTPPPIGAELLRGNPARGFGGDSVLRIGGQSVCVDDDRLDLAGWYGTEGAAGALSRMGHLRAQLMGEFDRIDRRVQRDLAQLYVSLGFGAEARALLRLDDALPDPVLMTLATLSEGGSDLAGVFAGQSECDGRAALWALLGARALPQNAELSEAAVLQAFEDLPQPLRRSIGPRLAERFAQEGRFDAARNVLSRLGRALGQVTEEMRMAAARIARASGAPEEAENLLATLIAAPGNVGVAAAVEKIDLAAEVGHPVDEAMVELTAAYSTERRATEQRAEVWLAHVRAAWASGAFDRAFEELAAAPDIAPEIRLDARNEALRALAENADDGEFLRRALKPENLAMAAAFPRTAARIAGRLLELGLPAEAGRWLEGPAPAGEERLWRLLGAREALAEQDPERAEIALVGLQGDEVMRLRAEAREMMGDYEFALDAYRALGDLDSAARLAWLAGEPATIDKEDPLLAAMAELSLPANTVPSGAVPSLSVGQALVDSGEATVETIRALLAQTAVPEL